MQIMSEHTKFAHLGKPGTAFSAGFARRLELITKLVDLRDKKIVDVGCGEGVWLNQFAKFTAKENVFGSDLDPESLAIAKQNSNLDPQNLVQSPAEELPWDDDTFDIVFSNEVLEHVTYNDQSVAEAVRVLRPGGKFIIFTPNRGWPFETHGMFWRGKYYWGNIPLLPWLPKFISKKFAPHVRNYSNGEIRRLFKGLSVKIIHHSHVFPGFDGMVRRFGIFGVLVQRIFHILEKTPLHFFGISHFLIVEKLAPDQSQGND